jgi:hypothetical protein
MANRRSFLLTSTAALASACIPAGFAQPSRQDAFTNASLGAYRQGLLTQSQFERRTGSLFMIFLDETEVLYTRLRSVTPYEPSPPKPAGRVVSPRTAVLSSTRQVNAFTLLFDCDRPLPAQDSYIVDHATLGRFVMFLVPGASPAGDPICTAVFSTFAEA